MRSSLREYVQFLLYSTLLRLHGFWRIKVVTAYRKLYTVLELLRCNVTVSRVGLIRDTHDPWMIATFSCAIAQGVSI